MAKGVQKYKNVIIISLLCITFLMTISFTSNREKASIAEDGIVIPINAIQRVVFKTANGISDGIESIAKYNKLKDENKELKKEIEELQSEMSKLNTIKKDYEDLKEILNYQDTMDDYNYITCEIIGKSGEGYFQGFTVNRGSDDGIKKRMVAVTPKGLVGQVSSVGKNWAKIQTLANGNIAVAGYVKDTGEMDGIIRGYRDEENKILAKIEMPSLESKMKEGDSIYTSGVGGIYPKGIAVGTVKEVYDNKSKVVKYGMIEPTVEINKIDKLSIIVPKEIREIDE